MKNDLIKDIDRVWSMDRNYIAQFSDGNWTIVMNVPVDYDHIDDLTVKTDRDITYVVDTLNELEIIPDTVYCRCEDFLYEVAKGASAVVEGHTFILKFKNEADKAQFIAYISD